MVDFDKNLLDTYFQLIDKLGDKSKLELISRLSNSIKTKKSKVDKSVLKLYGAFDTEESVKELIEMIRSSRFLPNSNYRIGRKNK